MTEDDQSIAERNEDRDREQRCGGATVSALEERQDCETGEDIADSRDPHEGERRWIVNRDTLGGRGSDWVEDEVDADRDDGEGDGEGGPEQW